MVTPVYRNEWGCISKHNILFNKKTTGVVFTDSTLKPTVSSVSGICFVLRLIVRHISHTKILRLR